MATTSAPEPALWELDETKASLWLMKTLRDAFNVAAAGTASVFPESESELNMMV